MKAFTPTNASPAQPITGFNAAPIKLVSQGARAAAPSDQRRKQEEDRVFEARLRWFLAVSAAA